MKIARKFKFHVAHDQLPRTLSKFWWPKGNWIRVEDEKRITDEAQIEALQQTWHSARSEPQVVEANDIMALTLDETWPALVEASLMDPCELTMNDCRFEEEANRLEGELTAMTRTSEEEIKGLRNRMEIMHIDGMGAVEEIERLKEELAKLTAERDKLEEDYEKMWTKVQEIRAALQASKEDTGTKEAVDY